MKQAIRILDYLRDHKTITRAECMTQLGIMEITPRISELESVGFVFNRERVRHENKAGRAVNLCRYSIAQYPQGWKQ